MNIRSLVATTGDRPKMLYACLRSLRNFAPSIPVTLVGQGVPDHVRANVEKLFKPHCVWQPERTGAHNAKVAGMNAAKADVWVSLDDDMELTKHSNFFIPAEEAVLPGRGLISTNWGRSEKVVAGKVKAMRYDYVNQAIVFTGGGMVFSDEVANLVRAMPAASYVCDNTEWSLKTYIYGYKNCRFLGSLTIHRVCSKGGRQAHLMQTKGTPANPDLITLQKSKPFYPDDENNFMSPVSADVTDLSHELHRAARAARGWA